MARKISTKTIKVHEQCACGYNHVYTIEQAISTGNFKALGIRYKKGPDGWYLAKNYRHDCPGHDVHLECEREMENDY